MAAIGLAVAVAANLILTAVLFRQGKATKAELSASREEIADMKAQAVLEKQSETATKVKQNIAVQIAAREIVPETILVYIEDEELRWQVMEYNGETAQARRFFERRTMEALQECFGTEINMQNYLQLPPEVDNIIQKITRYSMYGNGQQLIDNDTELAQLYWLEPAMSNEKWKNFIETETNLEKVELYNNTVPGYYERVGALIAALCSDMEPIIQRIMAREIVEDSWFGLIKDQALLDKVKEYNQRTAECTVYFTERALGYVKWHFSNEEYIDDLGFTYFDRPAEIKLFVPKVVRYTLYSNCSQLIENDPELSPMLSLEDSLGKLEWIWRIRTGALLSYGDYIGFADQLVQELMEQ